jgi:hypothetical protein
VADAGRIYVHPAKGAPVAGGLSEQLAFDVVPNRARKSRAISRATTSLQLKSPPSPPNSQHLRRM